MSRKRFRGAAREVWGILNPYGDVWTTDTFATPEQATAYVQAFWRDIKDAGALTRFKVIKVRVRVTALQQPATPDDGGEAVQTSHPGLDQKPHFPDLQGGEG